MVHKTEKDIALEAVVDAMDEAMHEANEKEHHLSRISESTHYYEFDHKTIIEIREHSRQFLIYVKFSDLPPEFLPVMQQAEKVGYTLKYTTMEAEHPRNI
jgi:hypothetical protein